MKQTVGNQAYGEQTKSVAVLLVNVSESDAEIAFLARRLTATLINLLSREPKVRVLAYNTVRNYQSAGKTPAMMGAELAVNQILVSEILSRNAELDIQSELINTSDGTLLCGVHQKKSRQELSEQIESVGAELVQAFHSVLKSGSTHISNGKRPRSLSHQPRLTVRIRGSKSLVF